MIVAAGVPSPYARHLECLPVFLRVYTNSDHGHFGLPGRCVGCYHCQVVLVRDRHGPLRPGKPCFRVTCDKRKNRPRCIKSAERASLDESFDASTSSWRQRCEQGALLSVVGSHRCCTASLCRSARLLSSGVARSPTSTARSPGSPSSPGFSIRESPRPSRHCTLSIFCLSRAHNSAIAQQLVDLGLANGGISIYMSIAGTLQRVSAMRKQKSWRED